MIRWDKKVMMPLMYNAGVPCVCCLLSCVNKISVKVVTASTYRLNTVWMQDGAWQKQRMFGHGISGGGGVTWSQRKSVQLNHAAYS